MVGSAQLGLFMGDQDDSANHVVHDIERTELGSPGDIVSIDNLAYKRYDAPSWFPPKDNLHQQSVVPYGEPFESLPCSGYGPICLGR